jgi:hypothetical protein
MRAEVIHQEQGSGSQRWALIGVIAAAAMTSIAAFAASAQAGVITPHVATPQVVTPQPAPPSTPSTPPPSPSSAPAPPDSGSGASSDGGPTQLPGSAAGDQNGPARPEGLPDHWDPACDLSCLQDWYAYYNAEFNAAEDPAAEKLFQDEVEVIEDSIRAMGGTPDAMGAGDDGYDPAQSGQDNSAASASSPPAPSITGTVEVVTGPDFWIDEAGQLVINPDSLDLGDAVNSLGLIPALSLGASLLHAAMACGSPDPQERPSYCPS